jgi:dTDP-4-amino-4,6-dideoxygalactose transaminase
LDGLQAALRVKLPRPDEWNEKRRRLAQLCKELLEQMNVVLSKGRMLATHTIYV